MKNYALVQKSMRKFSAPKSKGSACPDCGRQLSLQVDYRTVAQFPVLLGLEGLIICNDCADFRHALRDAEEIMYRVCATYRKGALVVCAKSRNFEAIKEDIDNLNSNCRPVIRNAVVRVMQILSTRSCRPVTMIDQWVDRILSQWEKHQLYGGEVVVQLSQDDRVWSVLRDLRASFGVVIRHHGKPAPTPEPEPDPNPEPTF